jgi:hypothetical protein
MRITTYFFSKLIQGVMLLAVAWPMRGSCAADDLAPENHFVAYPRVVQPAEGISWPAGQALPTFAAPEAMLDAIDVRSLSRDEQITFSALQGIVNRKRPRLMLLDARSEEGRDTWADTATNALGPRTIYNSDSKYQLLGKYVNEIQGIILYDPQLSPHYRNLAGTVAALNRAIPASIDVAERLKASGIEIDVLGDLTTLPYRTPIEIYTYLLQQYWPQCEKRLLVSARPDDRGGDHHHTRDMAAACGAAVVWLDGRDPDERALMRKFFGDMQAGNAIVLGWYSTERSGITTASEFGIGTMPADHYFNSTVFSGVDHRIHAPPVPKRSSLENKAYVAIFISDGDNIQYTQRAMRRLWDSSANVRGQVPLNWTIAPGLVDIGPGLLNYYYSTATSNDCFVTGPSGMGYSMPFNTLDEPGAPVGLYTADPSHIDGYTRLTETYLQRSGLRVITVWDDLTPMQRAAYAKNCRSLYGVTVHNFKDVPDVASSVEQRRVRFEKLVIPYATTYEHIRRSLDRELTDWDGQSPKFLAYQVAVWKELKPDRILELQKDITSEFGDRVEFVRADHYFNGFSEANGLPFALTMSEATTVSLDKAEASGSGALLDGTSDTVWTYQGSGKHLLQIDFGKAYMLSRYVVRHAGASGMDQELNTRGFRVEVSADGESWTNVGTWSANREDVTDAEMPEIAARYWRMRVTDPGADGIWRVGDIEVFGARK